MTDETETLPPTQQASEAADSRVGTNMEPVDFEPVLLMQLQDDLSRSRLREAFWISVVVHLVAIMLLAFSPKLFPGSRGVLVRSAEDLLRNKELTYLAMPSDRQTPPKQAPKTDKISDKNRIAMTRTPELDRKTLQQLRDMRPAGAPARPAQPPQPAQAPQQAMQGGGAQMAPQQRMAQPQPQNNPQLAMNTPPPRVQPHANPFASGGMSAGSQISQAARSSARSGFSRGTGGQYGAGLSPQARRVRGDMEILSDTQGVDFGPYLSRLHSVVERNWLNLVPESVMPPLMKRGKVTIEFAIKPDGTVVGLRIVSPSGDIPMDRAAFGGITASNPFSPLPSQFHGPYLALRAHFYYNPDTHELE